MNMKKLIQPSSAPSERLWRLPMMTALAVCLCLFASGALAQTTGSATLRGSVKDANGAVVANATVTLINEATKVERKTTTNRDGIYVFSSVLPGTYSVTMSAGSVTAQPVQFTVQSPNSQGGAATQQAPS